MCIHFDLDYVIQYTWKRNFIKVRHNSQCSYLYIFTHMDFINARNLLIYIPKKVPLHLNLCRYIRSLAFILFLLFLNRFTFEKISMPTLFKILPFILLLSHNKRSNESLFFLFLLPYSVFFENSFRGWIIVFTY